MNQVEITYNLLYRKNGTDKYRKFYEQNAAWTAYDKVVSGGFAAKLVQVSEFVIAEHEPEREADE